MSGDGEDSDAGQRSVPSIVARASNPHGLRVRDVPVVPDNTYAVRHSHSLLGMVAVALSVLTPVAAAFWWVVGQQIAAAETRMELKVTREVPVTVRTELLSAGFATSDQMATANQHLTDVDRQLFDLNRKVDELLKRRQR